MDNKPAVVTLMQHEPHAKHTNYYGVTDNEIKALQKYGSMNIIACKKIDESEEEWKEYVLFVATQDAFKVGNLLAFHVLHVD